MAEQVDILDSNLIKKEKQLFSECTKWVLYPLLGLLIILVPTVSFCWLHGIMFNIVVKTTIRKQWSILNLELQISILSCTFKRGYLCRAVAWWIPAGFHTRGSTRHVVPLTFTRRIVVITEESWGKKWWKWLIILSYYRHALDWITYREYWF